MSEWVNCTGINGAHVFVNLANVLTITSYGAGTRLAMSGNSQTYLDVAETAAEILALPRIGTQFGSVHSNTPDQDHDQDQLTTRAPHM